MRSSSPGGVALESISGSLRAIWKGLRVPGFYILLLVSLIGWALAYQHKTAYTVDLGGLGDNAYVSGFHDKERNNELDYRWSQAISEVRFPGVGNQPVLLTLTTIGYRLSEPSPSIKIEAREQTFDLQTSGEPQSVTFQVERGDPLDGNFTLAITSPTFSPPNDPRRLGIILDSVTVTPGDYGLRPFVIPPIGTLAALLLGLICVYFAVLITTRKTAYAMGFSAICALIVGCLIMVARPELGLLAGELPSLWAWTALASLLGRAALDVLIPPGVASSGFVIGAGSAAFAAAFLLRFGGLTYPQFLSSDLLLHVHNVQQVLGGQWLFTEPLPDGTLVPYPNALYVLLSPFAALLGKGDEPIGLLLKWSASLFDAATCLALAWSCSRLRLGRAGGIAALVYAFSPAPFALFSAGNYSNLFGQAALNLTLLGGMVFLSRTMDDGRWTMEKPTSIVHRPSSIVLLTIGFCLTMLGHYGMMLATLGIMGIFALWAILATVRRERVSAAWTLIGAWGAALVVSFALYYWRFTGEMWRQWSGAFVRLNNQGTVNSTAQAGGGFLDFAGKRIFLVGPLAAIIAVFGATQLGRLPRMARALLASWVIAAVVFAILDQAVGDTVRWYYLVAAPVSLLVGRYLAKLSWRGRAATLLAALSLLAMLWHTLGFWVGDLIFVRYH